MPDTGDSLYILFVIVKFIGFIACCLLTSAFVSRRFLRRFTWPYMSFMVLLTFFLFYGIGIVMGKNIFEVLFDFVITPVLMVFAYSIIATFSMIPRRIVLDSEFDT